MRSILSSGGVSVSSEMATCPGGSFYFSLKFNGEDNGRIRILDNVFGKSQAGNTDDWDPKSSNVWTGNKMTTGRTARP